VAEQQQYRTHDLDEGPLHDDDEVAGVVTEMSKSSLTFATVSGTVVASQPVEPGTWIRLNAVHRVRVLERFIAEEDLKPGWFVAVRFRGRGQGANGRRRWLVDVAGLPPPESTAEELPEWMKR
jgi:hypothetical protein